MYAESLSHLGSHIKRFEFSQRLLYLVSFMLFFWALFDGILGYLVPVVITSSGLSKTEMGLIFGFSSVAGAVFDFLLSKYLKNTHFRRIYLIMFACCFVYPLLLWQAKGIWLYLLAMSVWGLYYDLENFGNYDFVGRKAEEEEHASHFGVM